MKSNGLLVYVYLLYILVNVCARIYLVYYILLEWYIPAHSHTHKPNELAKVVGQCRSTMDASV